MERTRTRATASFSSHTCESMSTPAPQWTTCHGKLRSALPIRWCHERETRCKANTFAIRRNSCTQCPTSVKRISGGCSCAFSSIYKNETRVVCTIGRTPSSDVNTNCKTTLRNRHSYTSCKASTWIRRDQHYQSDFWPPNEADPVPSLGRL